MTYFLLAALAVTTYLTFYYRAQVSELSNLYANKCWDYDAAMAVNGELQGEVDLLSEELEQDRLARFESEFYGNAPCEAAAIKAGYTYNAEGELTLDDYDALAWTAQDSTNDHIFYS